jgi:hypothetical protein
VTGALARLGAEDQRRMRGILSQHLEGGYLADCEFVRESLRRALPLCCEDFQASRAATGKLIPRPTRYPGSLAPLMIPPITTPLQAISQVMLVPPPGARPPSHGARTLQAFESGVGEGRSSLAVLAFTGL